MAPKGFSLVISGSARERKYFSSILRYLDWTPVCATSLAAALQIFTTANMDLVLLSENLRGMGLPTALRVLCDLQPYLPVALVVPQEHLPGFGSLPSAGIVSPWASVEDVRTFLRELEWTNTVEVPAEAAERSSADDTEISLGRYARVPETG